MSRQDTSVTPRLVTVLWPSFLVASAATVLLFTVFDPASLFANTGLADLSRMGAYSIGFFCFWLLTAVSSWLTCYFQRSPGSINRPSRKRV